MNFAILIAYSQNFTEYTASFIYPSEFGSAEWCDFDNDGFLDIIVTGNSPIKVTKLYHANGDSTFTIMNNTNIVGVDISSVDWGDFNNDGFKDIIICGRNASNQPTTSLYMNNGGTSFSLVQNTIFENVYSGASKWGDYNNDGNLDLFITGHNGNGLIAKVYRNNGSALSYSFTEETSSNIKGIWKGDAAWFDYNNDGKQDIIITGDTSYYNPATVIYKNNGDNSFTKLNSTNIDGGIFGKLDVGDYDGDGYMDIVVMGITNTSDITKIYKNLANGKFADQITNTLVGYSQGIVKWGDYDGDGDLDLFAAGHNSYPIYSHDAIVYVNNGNNSFVELNNVPFVGFQAATADWADFDNDGDLDIIIAGNYLTQSSRSKIYINNIINNTVVGTANTKPMTPTGLTSIQIGDSLILSWNRSIDSTTPNSAITYNLRIGTSNDSINLLSPQSNLLTGTRRIANFGNIRDTFYVFSPENSMISWSVQAIDNGYLASEFSVNDSIIFQTSSIQKSYNNFSFNVYPNPTSGIINIEAKGIIEICIYNNIGQLVYQKTTSKLNNKHTLNMSNYHSGLYILNVRTNSGIYCRKVIN
jgi:hypothetical protein